MGSRGPVPRGRISTNWSRDLAYAVGLLTTDGNLSKDGRHMELTSRDKVQLITFGKCLGIDAKISEKQSGYKKGSYSFRIQFGDVLFYQWLLSIGLGPNKSKTLRSLKIPDKYFFDFLRGCFDGDGSMYAYWDPRWKSSYMFYITFVSASTDFLIWLQKTVERLTKENGTISSGVGTFQLRYAKKGSLVLCKRMYNGKNLPRLERKFTKAQKIFRINQVHSNKKS